MIAVGGAVGYTIVKCIKSGQDEAQEQQRILERRQNEEREKEAERVDDYQHRNRIADKKHQQEELRAQIEEVDEDLRAIQARTRALDN